MMVILAELDIGSFYASHHILREHPLSRNEIIFSTDPGWKYLTWR